MEQTVRLDDHLIYKLITARSPVLALGCRKGDLLYRLVNKKMYTPKPWRQTRTRLLKSYMQRCWQTYGDREDASN